jgi:hypothetical protein
MKKRERKDVLDSDDEVLAKKTKPVKAKSNGNTIDTKSVKENDATAKKPRIQIKLRATVTTDESKNRSKVNDDKAEKKPLKRKRDEDKVIREADSLPIPKKRQKDASQTKKKSTKTDNVGDTAAHSPGDGGAPSETPIFLDLKFWKQCREALNGTFKAARKNLTQFDGWTVPEDLADKFTEIANSTLEKMNK